MLSVKNIGEGACYFNLTSRKWMAMNMLSQSFAIFYESDLIENLDELDDALANYTFNNTFDRVSDILFTKIRSPILDAIKIVTCFENVFKAELLLKGFAIHRIDANVDNRKYRELSRRQDSCPVKVSDLKRAEGLLWKRRNDYEFKSLTSRTLAFSRFLERAHYQKKVKLPAKLYPILRTLNSRRNSLHFMVGQGSSYGKQEMDELKFLRNLVNNHLVKRHNKLVADLNFHENRLLRPPE